MAGQQKCGPGGDTHLIAAVEAPLDGSQIGEPVECIEAGPEDEDARIEDVRP